MKDFSKLRTELNEHVDVSHNSMPPNILILRRKTVRQFPNHVMVALYYNERLNQYFSIPYGGDADDAVITPVSLKEAEELEQLQELSKTTLGSYVRGAARNKDLLMIKSGNMRMVGNDKQAEKYQEKSFKRTKGIRRAVEKMEESQQLMEDDEYLSHSTSRAGKAAQKASWMANFEKHVVKTNPAHSGKINWNDAHFHHSQGTAPEVAAKKYTDSNPTPFESHFHREEAEQIDELSKKTLKTYIKGAVPSLVHQSQNIGFITGRPPYKDEASSKKVYGALQKYQRKETTRKTGIERAALKLEEAEQLNEDIMDRLHYIRTSKISRNVPHDDGTKTMDVDAETAHAVLRHHSQLTGKAQEDFEQRIRGSRHTFGKAAYEARTGQKALGGVDKHNINEATNANPIDTLRKIRDTHSMTHVSHDDGTKTHVDHVTAHMLLTVHDALNPTNQEKFGTAMKKSKPMFHKMVDLGWKQVK